MRPKIIAVILLSPVLLLLGHTRLEHSHYGVISSGGVLFSLGDGWKCDEIVAKSALYPVSYVSRSGVTRVILLSSELSDPQIAAAGIRIGFDSNPKAVKGSFAQGSFISDSGVRGIHVCFRQQAESNGEVIETQCHHYLVKNRCDRCVAIKFMANAHGDSATVDQTIQSSLSLL